MKVLVISLVSCLLLQVMADDFEVATVIHPILSNLKEPAIDPNFGKAMPAISSSSDLAALHVVQGMVRLATSWDFEAYRHFCTAAARDPDCLMAYWGIAMSLAGGQHEFFLQREAAIGRMLDLVELGKGVELERGYAEAAKKLFSEGVRASGKTYEAVSKRFPRDIFSRLFSLFLLRDGYDTFGEPRLGQQKALEGIRELLALDSENVTVLSFWVGSQSESLMTPQKIREEVLPFARKLVELKPQYPPFRLMLAHVEARCGEVSDAVRSCQKAIELFEAYQESERVTLYDCESLIRARVYLSHLLATKGLFAEAMEVADDLAQMEIRAERVFSKGATMLLWEARTLGARIALGAENEEDFDRGLRNLDLLSKDQWFQEQSLVSEYRDSLGLCLGIRKAILAQDRKAANQLFERLLVRAKGFEARRNLASKTSSYSHWLRALNTMDVLVAEFKGALAEMEVGATRTTAINWYQSAADRQIRAENLLPPSLSYPLEIRLGRFYLFEGKNVLAREVLDRAKERWPNHLGVLRLDHDLLKLEGRADELKEREAQIQFLKSRD